LVDDQLRNIAGDAGITDVVLDINSPGGVARGVGQTANLIADLRASGKKVYAYTDGEMCSAAYWIASAADFIFAERSATIGSISAMAAGIDSSKRWKKEGLELKLYRTGELKGAGLQGKPWTAEEETAMAARVDVVDRDFKGFVKSRRPMLTAEAMNGNYWYASSAPKGMHDGLMDHVGILLEYLASSAGI
jgi:ClpP class serine protease